MSDDLSSETKTNDSSSPVKIRDGLLLSSRGGHKGGYRPRKDVQHLIESSEINKDIDNEAIDLDTKEKNEGAILVSEVAKIDLSDDAEDLKSDDDNSSDSSGIDLNLARDPKRCDFCGDLSHKSRFCPVLNQRNDRGNANSGGVRVCFQCHEEGHIRADCPKRIATCFFCNKQGHVKADCPKKANKLDAKKRERVTYTFRKPSSQKEEKDNTESPVIKDVYEIREDDDNENKLNENEDNPQHHVFVPLPVPASQIKKPVMLRSKLLSSDSEPSISHKILRSESSEDEDDMESCHESDDDNNNNEGNNILKEKIILKEENDKEEQIENGSELQTISVEIDGCVEFDTDDDSSYFDCSEGEDDEKKGLKRIMEEDECYGEDGALIDEDNINKDN
ncbi:hypothetical protein Mgra_00003402 [Meloidogyne graminicola]|uniref:CCHC-type domain-containing protein n=1 Tax=Meloidogyne graminicola TaxID=189291 RepID=A0A8S9ZVA8_9BILA|nr:hypothetical protein Mgra_00003402 [Meloidogyne graminicola]